MSIVASNVMDVYDLLGKVLHDTFPDDTTRPQLHTDIMPATAPAPPCVVVRYPSADTHVGMLNGDCPEWAWSVPLLVVARDTRGTDLPTLHTQIMHGLHRAGIRATSTPVNYQPPDHPAPIPAVEITAS